jgi:hypothetical protein
MAAAELEVQEREAVKTAAGVKANHARLVPWATVASERRERRITNRKRQAVTIIGPPEIIHSVIESFTEGDGIAARFATEK